VINAHKRRNEVSRTTPIKARDLAALIAHAMDSEQKGLVDSLPKETVNAVMKASPEFQNEAWWNSENSQMK
jgi:hypothetical protein